MNKVDFGYPKPRDLIDTEYGTLRHISTSQAFQEGAPALFQLACTYARTHKRHSADSLQFQFTIPVKHKGTEYQSHFGVNIASRQNKFEQVSYSLCLSTDKKIVRRFHLDYANECANQREHSPIFHLQYAGKLKDSIPDCTTDISCDGLDLPKFINTPMTLALLIHLVLLSFPDTPMSKLTHTSEWKNVMVANEENVFKPFFDTCSTSITRSISSKKSFFMDCFYRELGGKQ